MARRAAAVAEQPADDQTDDTTLDNGSDAVQDYRTGQVTEDDLGRSVAKRLGWTDKDEWKRDPAKWRDWREYLEDTPKEIDTLKERLRRTNQAAADAIEEDRRRARIEAQNEIRAAAEAGDADRAARAAQQLEQVSGPPPQTVAWMGRNPWFADDPDARAIATAEANRLAAQGASIEDQLEAAEAKVRRIFPHHFGQAERRETEEARTDVRRQAPNPPQVQAGTRTAETKPKARTFADIPPADRGQYDRYFRKRYEGWGLSKEDAEAKYAASYWREKAQ